MVLHPFTILFFAMKKRPPLLVAVWKKAVH